MRARRPQQGSFYMEDTVPGVIRGDALASCEPRRLTATEGPSLSAALATSLAASVLLKCEDLDQVLKAAIELARDAIGLERVALYVREPRAGRILLRGSWGTGPHGETTDEHQLSHELSLHDGLLLRNLRRAGACALYRPRATWIALEGSRPVVLGKGWVMVTPLINGKDLIGVIYNDAALSGSAVDASKQGAIAVLAKFVSMECGARCGSGRWEPLRAPEGPSSLVQRVKEAVDQNLTARGNELAVEFGVSPSYLARAFKREMGVSLVEYRNRRRMDRFWEGIQQHGRVESLKQAAADAGFGSYAQFHRMHKKFAGQAPSRLDPLRVDLIDGPARAASPDPAAGPAPWPAPG
jgi:AraC-like DNA-binding protein